MYNYSNVNVQDGQLEEIFYGLSDFPRRLPSKLFYDERGSQLFDLICELDEYYPTRTETSILKENINEITSLFCPDDILVELGSGSSTKTKILLNNLSNLSAYIPVDISPYYLLNSVINLRARYPNLAIHPKCADYTQDFELPKVGLPKSKMIGFYPGSTIGNFTKEEAKEFLQHISIVLGQGCSLIVGIDLKKNRHTLERAYNDQKGITAAFNLNILSRINREFRANFNTSYFVHNAVYNERDSRIEMHLISKRDQLVNIAENEFFFKKDEILITEYSYKYSLDEFEDLVSDSFRVEKVWVDRNKLFSVHYLTNI